MVIIIMGDNMKKILNQINNNIKPLERKVKNSRQKYFLNEIDRKKLDNDLKKLNNEYIKLEKIIDQELNK